MRNTLTVLDVPSPRYWTVRIPKPRLPYLSKATIRWTAALALSLGFNVGLLSEAWAAEPAYVHSTPAECQASAELHYAISGGDDAAYEDALEACNNGWTFADWRGYVPSRCEQLAGEAYDATGIPEDYAEHLDLCEAGRL